MIMWHFTSDVVARSLANYQEALKELFEICPTMEFHGTGNPILGAIEGHLKPARGVDHAPLLKHANYIHARYNWLFDGNRPNDIGPHNYQGVWNDYFFIVDFSVIKKFIVYSCTEARTWTHTSGDTSHEPAHETAHVYKAGLVCEGKRWGLSQWRTHAAEIHGYAEELPAELRDEYRQCVDQAGAEVTRWLKAVNEKPTVSLP